MKSYLTSTELIKSIKRRASIPTSQNTFTDEDFLNLASEELAMGIVPHIMSFNEEYFVVREDVPMESSKSNYNIPYRAIGNKLRDLSYKDTSGSQFELTRVSLENIYENIITSISGRYQKFYVMGSQVVLFPDVGSVSSGEKLAFTYYLRPNNLVKSSRTGFINSIDYVNGVVTLTAIPTNFSLNTKYDFVQIETPHKIYDYDLLASAINPLAKTVTFGPGNVPAELIVGDTLMEAGETFVPNIPSELHSMLAQRVAARCLEAMGDTQGLNNANTKLNEMEIKTGTLIDNRVEGAPLKVINKNSFLRSRS